MSEGGGTRTHTHTHRAGGGGVSVELLGAGGDPSPRRGGERSFRGGAGERRGGRSPGGPVVTETQRRGAARSGGACVERAGEARGRQAGT